MYGLILHDVAEASGDLNAEWIFDDIKDTLLY